VAVRSKVIDCFCLSKNKAPLSMQKQQQAFAWFCLSKTKAELSMQKQSQQLLNEVSV
jgi:hypothetical protein